jgi:hypothetical protein
VPHAAREGLDNLAVGPDGRLFALWLDDRTGPKQLYFAESADHGVTWSKNQLLYRSPSTTICECCHPSALFNAAGDVAVMWRNHVEGHRDLWFASRSAGAHEFTAGEQLGRGTWELKACPMDGGALFTTADGFGTVWQRAGKIYFARPGSTEREVAEGTQPVAIVTAHRSTVVWQRGDDLWASSLDNAQAPALVAHQAHFPALIAIPSSERLVLAYERGGDTVVAVMP